MSTIEVNSIQPLSSGTTVTLGANGKTLSIPSGCTITNSGTATGFSKVLGMSTAVYEGSTSTTSTSFSDIVTATHTPIAQNSKYLIEGLGGTVQTVNDKYLVLRCQVKENSGSFATINVSGGNQWTSITGGHVSYVNAPNAWAYFYTPTDTSSLSSIAFKFQYSRQNTSGTVTFGINNFAGSGCDGGFLVKITEMAT
jgi:hypothetical protein